MPPFVHVLANRLGSTKKANIPVVTNSVVLELANPVQVTHLLHSQDM